MVFLSGDGVDCTYVLYISSVREEGGRESVKCLVSGAQRQTETSTSRYVELEIEVEAEAAQSRCRGGS